MPAPRSEVDRAATLPSGTNALTRLPLPLRENLPWLAPILLHWIGWWMAYLAYDLETVPNRGLGYYLWDLISYFFFELAPILLLLGALFHVLSGRGVGTLLDWRFPLSILRRYGRPRVLWGFLLVLVGIPILLATYRDWKTAIPQLTTYDLDRAFDQLDLVLHGGVRPWELLQPLLGHPALTNYIDGLYIFWFEAQVAVLLWMAFSLRRRLRLQFLLSYVTIYILLGGVAAIALASGGPVYFEELAGGPDPYVPLMRYLERVGEGYQLIALDIQRTLWMGFTGAHDDVISGISAMPSIHVAIAALFVFLGLSVNRWLALGFGAFALLTLAASVHLAWHYAVDGYVAILAVALIWYGSGWLARRYMRVAGIPEEVEAG